MSHRTSHARKTDSTQADIVKGLRDDGYVVRIQGKPVDLIVTHRGWPANLWMMLECKPLVGKRAPKARIRKEQEDQEEFCLRHGVPYVTNVDEARKAIADFLIECVSSLSFPTVEPVKEMPRE